MKLIRSGENTLRISMTSEDLDRYSVSLEDFDEKIPHQRRIFHDLLALAKEETGFDAADERIYIQLYPKKDGGCELFIIKLEQDGEKKSCFLFRSFDDYYVAKNALGEREDLSAYRIRGRDQFFLMLPPPHPPCLTEYGERIKNPPSDLFLKSKCSPIRRA
ncbi:MAG: adaptor protein MecA [Clostridia bacterium]|nr:adaptor protein MecA [Clostridia bacterium]